MKVEIKDITQCVKELTVTVDAEQAQQDYLQILNKLKNQFAIPGFRKGKAPISLIERNYSDILKEEYVNRKINEYYKEAIEDAKLNPISQAEEKGATWEKGQDLVILFKVEVMPQCNIIKYKGFKIPFEPVEFKQSMIDDTIEDFRHKTATLESVEKSVLYDEMNITIHIPAGNEDSSTQLQQHIILGDNHFSQAFNQNLTGVKIGDQIKTKLFESFDEVSDPDIPVHLKDSEFLVEVKEIKRQIVPDINDDFAKDLEYDSLQDLRDKIADELKFKIAKDNAEEKKRAIITSLILENPFDLPPSHIRSYAEEMAKPTAKEYKIELEKLIPLFENKAVFEWKKFYILQELKKIENIEISEEEKEAMIAEFAQNLNIDVQKYKELYKKHIESEDFISALEEKKILDLVEKHSKFIPLPKEKKKAADSKPDQKSAESL